MVQDLRTRETLIRGPNKDDVYEWPKSVHFSPIKPLAMIGVKAALHDWHKRLGHPSTRTLQHLIKTFSLPLSSGSNNFSSCNSCQCNKSHRLPFNVSSLKSRGPLDLIYTDVWGPSPVESIDGFKFYVIFVDHFTKYTWFYPLQYKSEMFTLFPKFKALVENYFKTSIVSIIPTVAASMKNFVTFLPRLVFPT